MSFLSYICLIYVVYNFVLFSHSIECYLSMLYLIYLCNVFKVFSDTYNKWFYAILVLSYLVSKGNLVEDSGILVQSGTVDMRNNEGYCVNNNFKHTQTHTHSKAIKLK